MSSNGYSIVLSWDNEKTKFTIPVLPEKIEFSNGTKNDKVNISQLGEIIEKGTPNCGKYSWESFFPRNMSPFVSTKTLPGAKQCLSYLLNLMSNQTVVHLVVSGTDISDYCLITDLKYDESGDDVGSYNYKVDLTHYRSVSVRKLTSSSSTAKSTATSSTTRVSTQSTTTSKTYTVKSGDCLWSIAQAQLGDGNKWTTLWNLNSTTVQNAAKSRGVTASKNNPIVYSGTVLKLS